MARNAARSIVPVVLLTLVGCVPSPIANTKGGGAGAATGPQDPFTAAAAEAEPNERPYFEPARPFLTALASRNYSAVYDQLSSHAKAKMFPAQFTPSITEKKTLGTPLENVRLEQFTEWMGKAEAELGAPETIRHVSVDSVDPQVLGGRGDPVSVMLAIGSMPAEVPADIRRASIRAFLNCQRNRAWAEAIGQQMGVTADQVLSGQLDEDQKDEVEDSLPYMKVKYVLVEEGGQLKVGYFELMPPSIGD